MNLNNKLKLMSLNYNGITNKIDEILDFYNNVDLFCFQEHWLSTEECLLFNTISDMFCGYGNAAFDNSQLRIGRPFGGVGFMWNKNIDRYVSIIKSDYDWLICIKMFNFYIINVYMPYECPNNVDKFNTQLIQLFLYCDCLNTSNYCIIGDLNSNILNLKSLYSNNLIKYCDEKNLIISDSLLLEPNSYTCVSSAWNYFS